jgi:hypothetical protein
VVQAVDLVAETGCIGGGAKPGPLADLRAEQFGQALFQAGCVQFEAAVAFAKVGVVGLQRPVADSTCSCWPCRCRVPGGGDDGGAQVGVAMDERPVYPRAGGNARRW